ncbi:hypothetical protein ACHAWF_012473 [Thalassiosira exigua]
MMAKATSPTSPHTEGDDDSRGVRGPLGGGCSSFISSLVAAPLARLVLRLSRCAARRPVACVVSFPLLSLGMMALGIVTNYNELRSWEVWAPVGSDHKAHGDWIGGGSGFPKPLRETTLIVHAQGKNIFGENRNRAKEGIELVFEIVENIQSTPGYDELCAGSSSISGTDEGTCRIVSASSVWDHDAGYFEGNVTSNEDAIVSLSSHEHPGGFGIGHDVVIGNPQFNNQSVLEYGESYVTFVFLPGDDDVENEVSKFEEAVLDRLLTMQREWEVANDYFRLEPLAERSFDDELKRSNDDDLPLLLLAFFSMLTLCIISFSRKDPVLSRKWLGFGGVVTVVSSLVFSFGLLFTIGVPFTSLTPMVVFVILGTPSDRPKSASRGPFEVTFFVSLIVLDERRIRANRLDCCFCRTSRRDGQELVVAGRSRGHVADRVMAAYGRWLLRRPVSIVGILGFVGMFGVFAWSASNLTQYFHFNQLIPKDSYILGWWDSWRNFYGANGVRVGIYFRDVDFSDQEVRSQMGSYVRDLSDPKYTGGVPERVWFEDLELYVNYRGIQDLSFEEQLDDFLNEPVIYDFYGDDIVRDSSGAVVSSRSFVQLNKVDLNNVGQVADWLRFQSNVTSYQEVNQGLESKFFTWSEYYYIWEFYIVAPKEFVTAMILGVVCVTILAILFIPHWTSVFYAGVSMAMLNVDLLGFVQFCGIHLNPVTFVVCVISIGLMVDHVMHITSKYMETSPGATRKQRTQSAGVSTFLGVLPVAFASSEAFFSIFAILVGVIILGLLHGLMFIPAVLSLIGTLDSIPRPFTNEVNEERTADGSSFRGQSSLNYSVPERIHGESLPQESIRLDSRFHHPMIVGQMTAVSLLKEGLLIACVQRHALKQKS